MPGTKNTDSQLCKPQPAVILASSSPSHPHTPSRTAISRSLSSLSGAQASQAHTGQGLSYLFPQPLIIQGHLAHKNVCCSLPLLFYWATSPCLGVLVVCLGNSLLLLVSTSCSIYQGWDVSVTLCTFSLSSPDHHNWKWRHELKKAYRLRNNIWAPCAQVRGPIRSNWMGTCD